MVCPNCGHEISPSQNFCENCGLPLKKNINPTQNNNQTNNNQKNDDAVKSLSELEQELDQQEAEKKAQQQAQNNPNSGSVRLDPNDVDDRTRVYKFDKEQLQQSPAQKREFEQQAKQNVQNPIPPELGEKVQLDPVTHLPIYPDDKPVNNQQTSENQKETDNKDDGLLANMLEFLKNNILVDIIAVALVVVLFIIKRNYAWILLAVFLVAWFLTAQIVHGREIKLNQVFKRRKEPTNNSRNNDQQPTSQPQGRQQNVEDTEKHHKKTWVQRIIIVAAIVGFIASVTGPFVNGVSLSSTIASAANYSANIKGQSVLITNVSSAIRFICFISPVIVIIAANFHNHGSIRLVRIFSFLPSIIYVAVFGLFSSNLLNASLITGQYIVNGSVEFGGSFYVLIATSILSLLLSYTMHPRRKIKA